ncbi:glucose-1-phosphate adenylyltransferase [Anaerosinus gibii]|uniref:Glucose-1-phosphate adenylyltransferase n=1 Tax=Selenobaculum gibii TaxID=3054208 RepID=A0A9Y2AJ92_9FIRM|nr:glucose-1-phosphate adenylyltransferase [Selenobaculum gbiensis]WIW70836.1 glucose-1-phosphate adenylyltransferase [Selenobaculum gbiensis]
MQKTECLAMILAGGQGSRLGSLTKKIAKPAVPFGGKYRIIDFPLSNCRNSDINTVGILTQYQPLALHSYLGTGEAWDLDRKNGGVYILPPYAREKGAEWYKGTADAIYQNLNFIEMIDPEYVLILSGDHIYKMDYSWMLEYHKLKKAEATIGVIEVPWEEASRFGIMNTDEENKIIEFQEKPEKPESNLASMGIYIFNWKFLKRYLEEDARDNVSSHDFGKNIIPKMLSAGARMYSYAFNGYWKDVGTISSLWEANMDLLEDEPELNLHDSSWKVYSVNPAMPPHYVSPEAKVKKSLISEGAVVYGEVENSVIFSGVKIAKGAKVINSVVLPFTHIKEGACVDKAVVGQNCEIGKGAVVKATDGSITVVPEGEVVQSDAAKQVG